MTQPDSQETSVDLRPDWLKNVQADGTRTGMLSRNGKEYPYTIVRAGLAPLPYTVGFNDENSLFISEDVPEQNRKLIMGHEIDEKTRFAELPETERCRASLEAELSDAKSSLTGEEFERYVFDRTAFFTALVGLYEQPEQQDAVTPQFREAIGASRDYLRAISTAPTEV